MKLSFVDITYDLVEIVLFLGVTLEGSQSKKQESFIFIFDTSSVCEGKICNSPRSKLVIAWKTIKAAILIFKKTC